MDSKINELRQKLYIVLKSNNKEAILKISEELDQLIIQYYKEEKAIGKK